MAFHQDFIPGFRIVVPIMLFAMFHKSVTVSLGYLNEFFPFHVIVIYDMQRYYIFVI